MSFNIRTFVKRIDNDEHLGQPECQEFYKLTTCFHRREWVSLYGLVARLNDLKGREVFLFMIEVHTCNTGVEIPVTIL